MRRSTKSFSFLMEFILVLLFFSISSAVCVSIQSKASQMNHQANDMKIAIQLIQNYMSDREHSPVSFDEHGQVSDEAYFQIVEEIKEDYIEVSVMVNEEKLIILPDYEGEDEK